MPPKEINGHLTADGMRFAIVVSRYNSLVTEELLKGALDTLERHGANLDEQIVVRAPGGWELVLTTQKVLEQNAAIGKIDGVIALGCVMKGGTDHNTYIANEVTKGLAQLSMKTALPVSFGVLTPNTTEQALERSGLKMGNKGAEAALAAIEMANLIKRLA
ncbi:MAG: 6,7-dimethyl-8-ribityllumazine synthase [Sumerlaeia bacterium]